MRSYWKKIWWQFSVTTTGVPRRLGANRNLTWIFVTVFLLVTVLLFFVWVVKAAVSPFSVIKSSVSSSCLMVLSFLLFDCSILSVVDTTFPTFFCLFVSLFLKLMLILLFIPIVGWGSSWCLFLIEGVGFGSSFRLFFIGFSSSVSCASLWWFFFDTDVFFDAGFVFLSIFVFFFEFSVVGLWSAVV